MSDDNSLSNEKDELKTGLGNPVPEAARRALEEAAQRRVLADRNDDARKKEINGREGPDPARYGDWEKKGIAVDF